MPGIRTETISISEDRISGRYTEEDTAGGATGDVHGTTDVPSGHAAETTENISECRTATSAVTTATVSTTAQETTETRIWATEEGTTPLSAVPADRPQAAAVADRPHPVKEHAWREITARRTAAHRQEPAPKVWEHGGEQVPA